MHTRRVLSAHGACSGSLCTGNREGKRGPVLFHLFQLEGNGGRQQRRNRSQRNHTRTDAVGPAQGACRGNRSTKSAEEPTSKYRNQVVMRLPVGEFPAPWQGLKLLQSHSNMPVHIIFPTGMLLLVQQAD